MFVSGKICMGSQDETNGLVSPTRPQPTKSWHGAMNYKRKKPSKKKFRYLRRGWGGESENKRRKEEALLAEKQCNCL